MLLRSIEVEGFTLLESARVDLPERGIVLVFGKNGEGKSALFVEAPAQAIWGRTVRKYRVGKSPWPSHREQGQVVVQTNDFEARRIRSNGGTQLVWHSHEDLAPREHESSTKAKKDLAAIAGSFEVWRRTSVFSAQDAEHFTTAADADRKKLLEALLGLDRFDIALRKARAALVDAHKIKQEKKEELSLSKERKEGLLRQRAQLETLRASQPAKTGDEATIRARQTELRNQDNAVRKQQERLSEMLRATRTDIANAALPAVELRVQLQTANEAVNTLQAKSGTCPACKRPFDNHGRVAFESHVQEAIARTTALAADLKKALKQQELDQAEGEEVYNRLARKANLFAAEQAKIVQENANLENELRTCAARATLEGEYRKVAAEIDTMDQTLKTAQEELSKAVLNVAELEACEEVLSTRGARATILGKSLTGLEALANLWLSRLAGDLKLQLLPYTELKDGSQNEAISLVISGPACEDYGGCSGGQRRRIDIAILFALAEMSAAAYGVQPGTLLLDEITDSPLDEEGRDALLSVMIELSATRPLVVITHSREVLGKLAKIAVRTYEISSGTARLYDRVRARGEENYAPDQWSY